MQQEGGEETLWKARVMWTQVLSEFFLTSMESNRPKLPHTQVAPNFFFFVNLFKMTLEKDAPQLVKVHGSKQRFAREYHNNP